MANAFVVEINFNSYKYFEHTGGTRDLAKKADKTQ